VDVVLVHIGCEVTKYIFIFVDGEERRRAFVVTVAVTIVGTVVFALIGFPWWLIVSAAVMSFASILLRPSAQTLELAKQAEAKQLSRGSTNASSGSAAGH
jgi:MFS family permease